MDAFDREVMELEQLYEQGDIDLAEYTQSMNDLQRSYQDKARESAQQAYDSELERW